MKKFISILPLCLIGLTFTYSLSHLLVIKQITASTFLSFEKLFTSMFFLMWLFGIAQQKGFFKKIGQLIYPILGPLLHLNPNECGIYLASIFAGYPTFAKMIKDSLNNQEINQDSANHLLKICSHGSLGFIVLTLGDVLFQNLSYGWLLFSIQVLSNFLLAFFYRPPKIAKTLKQQQTKSNLITICKDQFLSCIIVFIYIYGFMLVCNIINEMFFKDIFLIHGLLEFSQGCLLLENHPFTQQILLATIYISFSGLSVLSQVTSLLDDLDLDLISYYIFRFKQMLIATSLALIYLIWTHQFK